MVVVMIQCYLGGGWVKVMCGGNFLCLAWRLGWEGWVGLGG